MPALTQIKLSAVKLIEDITKAPVGTLMQFGDISLIRAEYQNAGNPAQGVVEIEAGGLWRRSHETKYRQAFDITGLAEITLHPSKPVMGGVLHEIIIGGVYLLTDSSGSKFTAQAVGLKDEMAPGKVRFIGFLTLSGPNAGKVVNGADNFFFLGNLAVSPIET